MKNYEQSTLRKEMIIAPSQGDLKQLLWEIVAKKFHKYLQ